MIRDDVLKLLCCPETHQPLRLAPAEMVQSLVDQIQKGTLRSRNGQPVTGVIDGALLREDGQIVYLMRQGIPILLIDEGVFMV